MNVYAIGIKLDSSLCNAHYGSASFRPEWHPVGVGVAPMSQTGSCMLEKETHMLALSSTSRTVSKRLRAAI